MLQPQGIRMAARRSKYLFDNEAAEAGQRFGALSDLFDPVTFRHFERLGVRAGWRCWEVGAGGPTVANWVADHVGPDGYVLATDINTNWINRDVNPAVEVKEHDITIDPLPGGEFDVVHARLVLSHLPARATALEQMIKALRPGGWILIEDFDSVMPLSCIDPQRPEHHRVNQVHAAMRELLRRRGADLEYTRTLPRVLRQAGLHRVGADAFFAIADPAANTLGIANVIQVRDALIENALVTPSEIDAHLQAMTEGTVDVGTMPLISTWGRRATDDTAR